MKERGDDWFASASDGPYTLTEGSTAERRMLVKYMKAPDTTIGFERITPSALHALRADGTSHNEYYTTFSKATVKQRETITTAMAVLPLEADEDSTKSAEGIRFESTKQKNLTIIVNLQRHNRTLAIDLDDSRVTVRR